MKNIKTTISGILSALFGFLTIVTAFPSDLQAQILKVIPPQQAQYWTIGFAVITFVVRSYKSVNTMDTPSKPTITNNP